MKRSWLYILLFCSLPTIALAADEPAGNAFLTGIDAVFSKLSKAVFDVLFFSIGGFPLIVLWLLFAAIFLPSR